MKCSQLLVYPPLERIGSGAHAHVNPHESSLVHFIQSQVGPLGAVLCIVEQRNRLEGQDVAERKEGFVCQKENAG